MFVLLFLILLAPALAMVSVRVVCSLFFVLCCLSSVVCSLFFVVCCLFFVLCCVLKHMQRVIHGPEDC